MARVVKEHISLQRILSMKNKGLLSFKYPIQRNEGMWSGKDEGGLIVDILQDNPIDYLKFAEEKLPGGKIIWVLDGTQRITTADRYYNNEYAVSKSVERFMIDYPSAVLDEDGLQKYDEEGKPVLETKTFDVRGKKFKQLPLELQERFLNYSFEYFKHIGCSSEDISYHIKRYNAGKPMNVEQKGFTYIGNRWANAIKGISALDFFADGIGKYSLNDLKKGKVNRVIAESVMTINYINDYRKNYADNCKYLEQNANSEDFENFKNLVSGLAENIDTVVGQMFNTRDSFLWFGLYSKFVKTGLTDDQFNTFMLKLNKGMYTKDEDGKIIKDAPMTGICVKEIDGTTFEELWKNSSTKDVNVVKARIDFLTKLACDYFNVEMVEVKDEDKIGTFKGLESEATEVAAITDENLTDFISEFDDCYSNENINGAMESLILTTEGHNINDFSSDSLKSMVDWYEQNGNKKMLDECVSYKTFAEDADIENDDPYIAFYIWAAKYANEKIDEDFDLDIDVVEWIKGLTEILPNDEDDIESEDFYTKEVIDEKKLTIINNFREYINKEEF